MPLTNKQIEELNPDSTSVEQFNSLLENEPEHFDERFYYISSNWSADVLKDVFEGVDKERIAQAIQTPCVSSDDNCTPLHNALGDDDKQVLQLLLSYLSLQKQASALMIADKKETVPFYYLAAKKEYGEQLPLLINELSDNDKEKLLEIKDKDGNNFLHRVAYFQTSNTFEAVKEALGKIALDKMQTVNNNRFTVEYYVDITQKKEAQDELFELCKQKNPDKTMLEKHLKTLGTKEDWSVCQYLLAFNEEPISLEQSISGNHVQGLNLLHVTAKYGSLETMQLLLEYLPKLSKQKAALLENKEKTTLLALAAQYNSQEMVTYLLEATEDKESQRQAILNGAVLSAAVRGNKIDTVNYLLQALDQLDEELNTGEDIKRTPSKVTAIKHKNNKDWTPLHFAASKTPEMVTSLLAALSEQEKDAALRAEVFTWWSTPLHIAVNAKHNEHQTAVVKTLLEALPEDKRADAINAKPGGQKTVLERVRELAEHNPVRRVVETELRAHDKRVKAQKEREEKAQKAEEARKVDEARQELARKTRVVEALKTILRFGLEEEKTKQGETEEVNDEDINKLVKEIREETDDKENAIALLTIVVQEKAVILEKVLSQLDKTEASRFVQHPLESGQTLVFDMLSDKISDKERKLKALLSVLSKEEKEKAVQQKNKNDQDPLFKAALLKTEGSGCMRALLACFDTENEKKNAIKKTYPVKDHEEICTLCHLAAEYGNTKTVLFLLDVLGDEEAYELITTVRDVNGHTPQELVAVRQLNQTIDQLKKDETPTKKVREHLESCIRLLGEQAATKYDLSGYTPLHFAVQYDSVTLVEALLKPLGNDTEKRLNALLTVDIEVQREKEFKKSGGYNALHAAAYYNAHQVVAPLLQGLDQQQCLQVMQAKSNQGLTPLHLAAQNNSEACAQGLLDQIDKTEDKIKLIQKEDSRGWSTLQVAANANAAGMASVCLNILASQDEKIALITKQDDQEISSLHLAAKSKTEGALQVLLDAFKEKPEKARKALETESNNGWTPLHYAAHRGCAENMECLLKALPAENRSVIAHKKTKEGATLLHLMMGDSNKWEQSKKIKVLLEAIPKENRKAALTETNNKGWSTLHYAARYASFDITFMALKAIPPEQRAEAINQPLKQNGSQFSLAELAKNNSWINVTKGLPQLLDKVLEDPNFIEQEEARLKKEDADRKAEEEARKQAEEANKANEPSTDQLALFGKLALAVVIAVTTVAGLLIGLSALDVITVPWIAGPSLAVIDAVSQWDVLGTAIEAAQSGALWQQALLAGVTTAAGFVTGLMISAFSYLAVRVVGAVGTQSQAEASLDVVEEREEVVHSVRGLGVASNELSFSPKQIIKEVKPILSVGVPNTASPPQQDSFVQKPQPDQGLQEEERRGEEPPL